MFNAVNTKYRWQNPVANEKGSKLETLETFDFTGRTGRIRTSYLMYVFNPPHSLHPFSFRRRRRGLRCTV
jgi:hypothetical protein